MKQDNKDLLLFCKENGVRKIKMHQDNIVEAEFFPKDPEAMKLDPVSLSKALTDSLPPDSAMLFASSEDLSEPEEKIQ